MRFPERNRYPLALVAGAGLALAFPLPGWSGLAFLGPGLLVVSGMGLTMAQAFRVGYVSGLVLFLGSLRWLLNIPVPFGAQGAWLALSAYCAVYPGLWVMLASRLSPGATLPPTASEMPPQRLGWGHWRESLETWARSPWLARSGWSVTCAASWVALEMLRGWLLGGFPWNLLGTAFYKSLPLVQLASFTGVYGVSFLSVWASLALANAILAIALRKDSRWAWTAELRMPLICVLVLGSVGVRRIMSGAPETGTVRLALIQPSIPQTLIWDPKAATNRFEQILGLSKRALEHPVNVLIWPEGSLPDIDRDQFERMLAVTRPKGVKWILGGDETEKVDGEFKVYNSGFLIGTNGVLESTYRKRRLVVFGEYVPLEKALPFVKYLTPIGGSFSEGKGPVDFVLGEGNGMASPVICFEDVFPHGARTHVHAGIDFLLELTNDGWFGEGCAQWQHLAAAVFRATENGVPVVRCTNTGITCWIDRFGRVRELLQVDGTNPYGAGYLIVEVPLGTQKAATLYREKGDWFGWSCVVATFYAWLRNRLARMQIRTIPRG